MGYLPCLLLVILTFRYSATIGKHHVRHGVRHGLDIIHSVSSHEWLKIYIAYIK